MGQLYLPKLVRIQYNNKTIKEIEINVKSNLKIAREKLKKYINFPFVFVDDSSNEISLDDEILYILDDILDGKNLYIKKKFKKRQILGEIIDSKNDLNFYLFPNVDLSETQKKEAFNIMVVGETGVGKSTWINALLNYLEGIEIDENIRFLLFDEKQKRKEYEKKYRIKYLGESETDTPEIYEIGPTKPFDNSLQIIDTPGFGDTRGSNYDNKIIKDIKNLLETSKIERIHAICLVLKATETRAHLRLIDIFYNLFSLFGENLKKNFVIILTFSDFSSNAPIIDILKNDKLPFNEIFGDIKNLPIFYFNNNVYFNSNRKYIKEYLDIEKNDMNFKDFFYYLSRLQPSSLEDTKKIFRNKIKIREQINDIYINTKKIISEINSNKKYNLYTSYNSYFFYNNHYKTEEYIKFNNRLYYSLMTFIETFQKLILKNRKIIEISLIKEDVNIKNLYVHKVLKEIIKDKNKITDFIEHILPELDKINQKEKEDIVHNFLVKLIKDH